MNKIKLSKLQEELLKESIAIWKKDREKIKNYKSFFKNSKGITCCVGDCYLSHGISSCPLCQEYGGMLCMGCPIEMVSHTAMCGDTPYKEWEAAGTRSEGLKAHDRMIEYMENILP